MSSNDDQAQSYFEKFRETVSQFLDVSLHYVGAFPMSAKLRTSIVKRKPVSLDEANAKEILALQRIAANVIKSPVNSPDGIRFFQVRPINRKIMRTPGYIEQTGNIEELVTEHLTLVRKIAWHVHGRVASVVEIDDLVQVGYIGLVTAAQNYTIREGASFSVMPASGSRAPSLTICGRTQTSAARQ